MYSHLASLLHFKMDPVDVYVKSESVDNEDDIWDDESLIYAYDRAVNRVKERITKKMNSVNDDKQISKLKDQCKSLKTIKISKWNVGDYCRAKYSVDGLEYEAKIMKLISDNTCWVRYIGYNNEEEVSFENLDKSLGQQARKEQKYSAAKCGYISNLDESKCSYDGDSSVGSNDDSRQWLPTSGFPGIPPPPPPHILSVSGNPDTEAGALSAMLMSWYMNGYHSGYYAGFKEGKKRVK